MTPATTPATSPATTGGTTGFRGADTDELREVGGLFRDGQEQTDDVIAALRALIVFLRMASFWTGGYSAQFAEYLETWVLPWLQRISAFLGALAQLFGSTAQAQDETSAEGTVNFTLPSYTRVTQPGETLAQFTGCVLGGDAGIGVTAGTAVTGAPLDRGIGAGADPNVIDDTRAVGSGIDGRLIDDGGQVGTLGGGGTGGGGFGGASAPLGTAGGVGGSGATGGLSAGSGSGSGGSYGSASGSGVDGGSGWLGLGDSPVSTSGDVGARYGSEGVPGGDTGGTGPTGEVPGSEPTGDGASYGAAASIAGGAGVLGLGGAALAARAGQNGQSGQLGTGFTSPQGYDYTQIRGVRGNPNVTPEFLREMEGVARRVGARPDHLMAVMAFETGGTFSPSQRDGADGKARGLIQFRPSTARGLGTSTAALERMTAIEQLAYVERYLAPHRGRIDTVEGLYTSIFSGRPRDADDVLYSRGSDGYRLNSNLDTRRPGNNDGRITGAEAAARVYEYLRPARR